jgi:GT2 family glycosyltransferase
MNIDAIILSNSSDMSHYGVTCRTVNSLRESDKFNNINKIIIIESQDIVDFKKSGFTYNNCQVIHPQEKFGYNKFLNIGLKYSNSEWILICNNDLFFTKDWLSEMEKIVEKYPEFKSFSPRCPNWHLHQSIDGELLEGYTVSKNICGWCILLHRSVVEECDLFDEQFDFWYQDNDYAMTLESKNIKHALVPNSKVYHMISSSHDLLADRKYEMTHGQQQIFNKKWMI